MQSIVINILKLLDALQIFEQATDHFASDVQVNLFYL
jgi:hypothetical protein